MGGCVGRKCAISMATKHEQLTNEQSAFVFSYVGPRTCVSLDRAAYHPRQTTDTDGWFHSCSFLARPHDEPGQSGGLEWTLHCATKGAFLPLSRSEADYHVRALEYPQRGRVSSAAIQDDVSSWLCGYFVSVKEFCTAPHKNPILGQAPSITDATLLADVGGEKGMTVAECIAVFAFLWTHCETGVLKNGGREGGLGGTRPVMLSRR
ncbi:hypothetical protein EV126DRAFT_418900 [Verticillium dahliae]|nr:hypothetical protein EV126DRAFT_418900 [Verticillium dahliae]